MEIDDRITVSTPEGVDLDLVVAGVGSRFMSSLVDSAVQAVVIIPLVIVAGVVEGGAAIASLGVLLAFVGYPTVCDAFLDGRTLGRRLAGLRLVTTDGGPVGFLPAALRNIVRIVDFLPSFYSVGAIAVLVTPRYQRLGDLAAGTIVVRAAATRSGPVVPGATRPVAPMGTVPVALPEGSGAWDLTLLTPEDLRVVRAFLARRLTLDPDARHRVGGELARRLRPAVVGPDPALGDEELLEVLLAAKTARM